MDQLQHVLDCLRHGDYRVTLHGKLRMAERNVSNGDIRSCGESGKTKLQPDGKIKVTGRDLDGEDLTLVCVEDCGVLSITVF